MTEKYNQTSGSHPRKFSASPAPNRLLRRRAVAPALIGLFLVLAVGADLIWPSRKSYFATYTYHFKGFTILHPVPTVSFFTPGGGGQEIYSPVYMGLLRAVYAAIPNRLAAMRALSVACALLALYFSYKIASRLFSPSLAAVFLFLLVTSPIYVESMRAFGYQSLSQLAVVLVIYFTARAKARTVAAVPAACFSFLTLSLYVTSRTVVAIPLAFWALDFRRSWKKIAVFLALFAVLGAAAGTLSGHSPLGFWRFFVFPEEQAGLWPVSPVEERVVWRDLGEHLSRNAELAVGYLLNIGRVPFTGRDSASRLFNLVYTPFLFLGLLELRRWGRRAVLILSLMFLFFFIFPLASREIQPRRILLGIYPVYLLIALGMSFAYRIFLQRFGLFRRRAWPALIPLLVAGSWDAGEFLFRVARPSLGYSRPQLRAVADFVEANRKEVAHIRYFREVDELVMGNPYFAPRPVADYEVAIIFAEQEPNLMRRLTLSAVRDGEDLLYLFTDPPMRIGRDHLEWVEENLGEIVRRGEVPGAPNLRYLLVRFSEIAPNLLFKAGEEMRIRIREAAEPDRDADWRDIRSYREVFDGDGSTFRPVGPPSPRAPVLVEIDFGAEAFAVRSVSLRAGAVREEYFFRRAEFYGGPDGIEWERLTSIEVPRRPEGGEWLNFEFENPFPRRFYRLEIDPANWAGGEGPIVLSGIWIFDAAERRIKVEEVFTRAVYYPVR